MLKKFSFTGLVILICWSLSAQTPPHPNGGNNPNGSNTPVSGAAPIGGGLIVMLLAGAIYASKKTISFYQKKP